MESQHIIFGAIFALSLAASTANFAIAVDPSNTTVVKTPTNATVFLENGTNVSQPRTPLLVPSENYTTDNFTDANITAR